MRRCRKRHWLALRFPGKPSAYDTLLEMTDACLLARATVWAATEPRVTNQAFNIDNGDRFRWNDMWPKIAHYFELDYTTNIWDTLTLAYLMHPSFATQTVDEWVDVNMSFGANDGKSSGYTSSPPAGLQKMTVVKRFDNPGFSISMWIC